MVAVAACINGETAIFSIVINKLCARHYGGPQGSHQNKNHCTNKEHSKVKIINYKLL